MFLVSKDVKLKTTSGHLELGQLQRAVDEELGEKYVEVTGLEFWNQDLKKWM